MKPFAAACTFFFGAVVALVGNGHLRFMPEFTFVALHLTEGLVAPMLAFGLLAGLFLLSPRFVCHRALGAGVAVIGVLCFLVLAPLAFGVGSTDAQSGLFEYAICFATAPASLVVAIVAVLVRFILQRRLPISP